MYLDWYKIIKAVKENGNCCLNCLQNDFERENNSCSLEDFRKMLRGTLEADHLALGYIVRKIGCSLTDIVYTEDEDHVLPEELKKIAREYNIILRRDLIMLDTMYLSKNSSILLQRKRLRILR